MTTLAAQFENKKRYDYLLSGLTDVKKNEFINLMINNNLEPLEALEKFINDLRTQTYYIGNETLRELSRKYEISQDQDPNRVYCPKQQLFDSIKYLLGTEDDVIMTEIIVALECGEISLHKDLAEEFGITEQDVQFYIDELKQRGLYNDLAYIASVIPKHWV